MSNFQNNIEEIRKLSTETSKKLSLNAPMVVEKDFYVTKALLELSSNLESDQFKLVFKGGTCLAKSGVIQRMSEDCDFSIVTQDGAQFSSKGSQRTALRKYRASIVECLRGAGFIIDDESIEVVNEGQYIKVRAKYDSAFPPVAILKPFILLEFYVGELRLPSVDHFITTLIKKTFGDKVDHPTFKIECVAIEETAAEKWAALTRRVATSKFKEQYKDPNLVRHLYDLYKIDEAGHTNSEFYKLAVDTVLKDGDKFRTHNEEYHLEPYKEIERAINELSDLPEWVSNWEEFMQSMVYDKNSPTFEMALKSLADKTKLILPLLEKFDHKE